MTVYRDVKGSNLTAADFDANNRGFEGRIEDLETNPPTAISIDEFQVSGSNFYVLLSNGDLQGPFALPTNSSLADHFKGEWTPATAYITDDMLTANGSTYLVLQSHTSEASFDPHANNGSSGDDYYGLLLTNPGNVLPVGGDAGQMLVKIDGTDFNVKWDDQTVVGLATVSSTTESSLIVDGGYVGHYVRSLSPGGITVNVLSDETLAASGLTEMPANFECHFRQAGSGPIVLEPEVSSDGVVTINPSRDGHDLSTQWQGATITLKRVGANAYDMVGPSGALVSG